MQTLANENTALKGGEWLIKESNPFDTFTPEDFSEEQKMILGMCRQFMNSEVFPNQKRIDTLEPGLMPSLLSKAGELGLLGINIPEEYGGSAKDFLTASVVSEVLGSGGSFSVAFISHTGIGSLPILYFGTKEQRQKYLPKLTSGEWKGAYGLTEPTSGSDALGAKTTAKLSEDGKCYILNGQKCWISNGGFADVFTVFAKVDGDRFTAFIVERGYDGFTQGPEEIKMGIKGSSTVQLYFLDCKVPVENVLGEIGRGHIIAFNILNIGRYKLCAAVVGGAKIVINLSIKYAIEREQFNTSIANFGAIKHKLAEMAILTWTCESAVYRTGQLIAQMEENQIDNGEISSKALLSAAEEYALECAILKVYGSEILDLIVDESLQIHGGNGFSDEYQISRTYRDSRINRIFEGTNEINRLLITDMLLKRAMKGRLDLLSGAKAASNEIMSLPEYENDEEGLFSKEKKYIRNFKKATLMVAGAAVKKFAASIEKEQELLMNIADMVIYTYVAESSLLRLIKLTGTIGVNANTIQFDIVSTLIYDLADRINKAGKNAINRFAEGDELSFMLMGLRRFTKTAPFNVIAARRRIADKMIEEKNYCF